jgi:hypothetical protein
MASNALTDVGTPLLNELFDSVELSVALLQGKVGRFVYCPVWFRLWELMVKLPAVEFAKFCPKAHPAQSATISSVRTICVTEDAVSVAVEMGQQNEYSPLRSCCM